jgi:hypothetical protein
MKLCTGLRLTTGGGNNLEFQQEGDLKRFGSVVFYFWLVAVWSTAVCAEEMLESVLYSRTVEGSCKPGILGKNGEWDCRPSDLSPTCPSGKIGVVSEELRMLIAEGKHQSAVVELVKGKVQSQGLAQTIAWLACQGFSVSGHRDHSKPPSEPETLHELRMHAALKVNETRKKDLERQLPALLLEWQATKNNLNCILWVFCEYPGEFFTRFWFDRVGNIISAETEFLTEGP